MLRGIGKKLTDDIELVVTRENLVTLLFACFIVLFLDDLGVVFQNVGEAASM
jgi:hypothetical protein